MLHSIQDVLIHLCGDKRFVDVPVAMVVNDINRAVDTGDTTRIAGDTCWAVQNHDWYIIADRDNIVSLNGHDCVIGTPCYFGATHQLNIMQNTVVIGTIDKALFAETISDKVDDRDIKLIVERVDVIE
jgi:hypothetical protein